VFIRKDINTASLFPHLLRVPRTRWEKRRMRRIGLHLKGDGVRLNLLVGSGIRVISENLAFVSDVW
jgi:hypothetical protein